MEILYNFNNQFNNRENLFFFFALVKTWTNTVDQDPFSNMKVERKRQFKCLYFFINFLYFLSIFIYSL